MDLYTLGLDFLVRRLFLTLPLCVRLVPIFKSRAKVRVSRLSFAVANIVGLI